MYNTVIFDLDGTLLNTIEDLMDSTNYALNKYNYPSRSLSEIISFVGNGVGVLIKKAMPNDNNNDYEEVLTTFKTYYETHNMIKTKPYEGIIFLIKELKKENIKMAIVSNKFQKAVEEICLPLFGDYIPIMYGESDGIRRKPYPDMVKKAMLMLKATPKETVYVGDSEVDVATAINTGIDIIGVDWGFRGKAKLKALGVTKIALKPSDIKILIK